FVADERPLWLTLDNAGRVRRLGDASGTVVTAGIYLLSETVCRMALERRTGRLRDFLRWIVERGEPVYGVSIPVVVALDREEVVELAGVLIKRASADEQGWEGAVL